MNLKNQVKRLEMEAENRSERDFCQHEPPMIQWPDGSIENESIHQCSKPRLQIFIGYSDNSDARTQQGAVDCFERLRTKFPSVESSEILSIIKETWPLMAETEAKLQERAAA
jgi:hypothetical protein